MILDSTRKPRAIAISVSESPDMAAFGLGAGHLRHAMAELALFVLSSGKTLVYGGDLRSQGFTELLFQLVLRYRQAGDRNARVVDYLAWPVHIRMEIDELASRHRSTGRFAQLVLLRKHGEVLTMNRRQALPSHEPDDVEWTTGLTGMRQTMRSHSDARIILGGRVEGYKGRMPGIAEEALLSLESQQPVFLAGGFGGCARDISETLGLVGTWAGSRSAWPGRQELERYRHHDLRNGLSLDENRILAATPHVDRVVTLVLRGLHRLQRKDIDAVTHSGGEG